MMVIQESGAAADLERLDRAWSADETFAFVPGKGGASRQWVDDALGRLPVDLQRGHFALLTSGSTGSPKLVVGERRRTEALAAAIHVRQESESVAETIVALPLHYSYAFVNQWVWSRRFTRRIVATRGFSKPDELRAALRRADRAAICLVGIQVPLLQTHFADEPFPGVLRVNFAGGRFPQEQLARVRRSFPAARIFNNFGCAEAMPRLTIRPAEDSDEAADIGVPLPGIEMRANEQGELLFRSPYGAVGFVDESGFTSISPDDWVRTGDLGAATARGTWRITGRAAEVFKRHGEKVSLQTLLATVHHVWGGQAAFYREPDPSGEEAHVLVLAPQPAEEQLRSILKALRANHPRAWWPLRVESVAAMPLLPSGKVDVRSAPSLPERTVHWYQRL